jgi:hypothetical protein
MFMAAPSLHEATELVHEAYLQLLGHGNLDRQIALTFSASPRVMLSHQAVQSSLVWFRSVQTAALT